MGSGVRTGVASKECAKTGVEVPWSTEDEDVSVTKGTWRGEGWGLEIEEGGGVCQNTVFIYIYYYVFVCLEIC